MGHTPCHVWVYVCPRAHFTKSARLIAPLVRATSRPSLNKANVGMLRMLNRAPTSWWASVSTFASNISLAKSPAAASNCGAMVRQGPHQGAQKSTNTGMALRLMCLLSDVPSSATGLLVCMGRWQRPQVALATSPMSRRLVVWQ